MIVPWIRQWYWNVPAFGNVVDFVPDVNDELSLGTPGDVNVTVCAMPVVFDQVTVVPFATVTDAGL
jgi:hypothetical protein